jgi:hypothetical protein
VIEKMDTTMSLFIIYNIIFINKNTGKLMQKIGRIKIKKLNIVDGKTATNISQLLTTTISQLEQNDQIDSNSGISRVEHLIDLSFKASENVLTFPFPLGTKLIGLFIYLFFIAIVIILCIIDGFLIGFVHLNLFVTSKIKKRRDPNQPS